MPFKKGNKLSKGRPKGSKNITTWQKEFFLKYIQEEGAGKFVEEMSLLHGKDYVEQFTKILPYGFAKRAPVDEKGETVRPIPILSGIQDVPGNNSNEEDQESEETD